MPVYICLCIYDYMTLQSRTLATAIIAALYSGLCSPYHCVIWKGKVRTQEIHTSSLTVSIYSSVNNFPFSNEATTSWLLIFLSSLLLSFFLLLALFFFVFFSERCVTGLWFTHYSQCTGSVLWQNRSLSLFPLLTEDHRAKFNANNKITGAQNTHFHIHRSFI